MHPFILLMLGHHLFDLIFALYLLVLVLTVYHSFDAIEILLAYGCLFQFGLLGYNLRLAEKLGLKVFALLLLNLSHVVLNGFEFLKS